MSQQDTAPEPLLRLNVLGFEALLAAFWRQVKADLRSNQPVLRDSTIVWLHTQAESHSFASWAARGDLDESNLRSLLWLDYWQEMEDAVANGPSIQSLELPVRTFLRASSVLKRNLTNVPMREKYEEALDNLDQHIAALVATRALCEEELEKAEARRRKKLAKTM